MSLCQARGMSLQHLPDDLLRRILTQAYRNQIVSVFQSEASRGLAIACSLPPCHLVSNRIAKFSNAIPIRLLQVTLSADISQDMTRLLCSIRCPVQVMDFSDNTPGKRIDWTPMLEFVTCCPYPEQVQTVRIIHSQNRCEKPGSQCSHLQEIVITIQHRMPQCQLLLSSHRN